MLMQKDNIFIKDSIFYETLQSCILRKNKRRESFLREYFIEPTSHIYGVIQYILLFKLNHELLFSFLDKCVPGIKDYFDGYSDPNQIRYKLFIYLTTPMRDSSDDVGIIKNKLSKFIDNIYKIIISAKDCSYTKELDLLKLEKKQVLNKFSFNTKYGYMLSYLSYTYQEDGIIKLMEIILNFGLYIVPLNIIDDLVQMFVYDENTKQSCYINIRRKSKILILEKLGHGSIELKKIRSCNIKTYHDFVKLYEQICIAYRKLNNDKDKRSCIWCNYDSDKTSNGKCDICKGIVSVITDKFNDDKTEFVLRKAIKNIKSTLKNPNKRNKQSYNDSSITTGTEIRQLLTETIEHIIYFDPITTLKDRGYFLLQLIETDDIKNKFSVQEYNVLYNTINEHFRNRFDTLDNILQNQSSVIDFESFILNSEFLDESFTVENYILGMLLHLVIFKLDFASLTKLLGMFEPYLEQIAKGFETNQADFRYFTFFMLANTMLDTQDQFKELRTGLIEFLEKIYLTIKNEEMLFKFESYYQDDTFNELNDEYISIDLDCECILEIIKLNLEYKLFIKIIHKAVPYSIEIHNMMLDSYEGFLYKNDKKRMIFKSGKGTILNIPKFKDYKIDTPVKYIKLYKLICKAYTKPKPCLWCNQIDNNKSNEDKNYKCDICREITARILKPLKDNQNDEINIAFKKAIVSQYYKNTKKTSEKLKLPDGNADAVLNYFMRKPENKTEDKAKNVRKRGKYLLRIISSDFIKPYYDEKYYDDLETSIKEHFKC